MTNRFVAIIIAEIPCTDLEIGELVLVGECNQDGIFSIDMEETKRTPWALISSDIEILSEL